ncbi:MAG: hypothetical protein HQL91_01355 [Magnetococcales bacterium]|nr:hypothetical protein [Magnetococcales bacterium]
MSHALTIDDIWKLFEKTNRIFQESEEWNKRNMEETRRAMQESRAETERVIRESRAETERAMQESRAETERERRETERVIRESRAETERERRETERVVKEVSRQIGQLGSRWGEFVEGLVAPACKSLFMERGIPVHRVGRRMEADLPGNRRMEIDLMVVNTDAVILVEVKSKLKHEDVRDHLVRVAEFKDFFPEYADKRIMGAVAGIVIDEKVDQFAMNQGLFVIVQSGDTVTLANAPNFVPKSW